MEFKVNREELKNALAWIQNVVEKKTTKPILTNTLLNCENNDLILNATDLEVGIQIKLPAQVKQPGKLAVPAKYLYDIVREIQASEIAFQRRDDHWLEISAGRSKFKVAGLPAAEFPSMPSIRQADFHELPAGLLKAMISKTSFAISTDEAKFNLNGICLEKISENLLRMVATDGHRMSYEEKKIEQDFPLEESILLPRKGIIELQKLVTNEEKAIPILIENRNFIIQLDQMTLFIRMVDGAFPNYQKIIPQNHDLMAQVSTQEMVRALRRVSLLCQEHHRGVKLIFSPGHLELLCRNPDLGEAHEEIECDYKGKALEVGFNFRYLLDVFSVIEDETTMLKLKDEVSPCLIYSPSDQGFFSMVMPMRL